ASGDRPDVLAREVRDVEALAARVKADAVRPEHRFADQLGPIRSDDPEQLARDGRLAGERAVAKPADDHPPVRHRRQVVEAGYLLASGHPLAGPTGGAGAEVAAGRPPPAPRVLHQPADAAATGEHSLDRAGRRVAVDAARDHVAVEQAAIGGEPRALQ